MYSRETPSQDATAARRRRLSPRFGADGRAQPALDLVEHARVDLRLGRARALRYLERVVAGLDDVEFRRRLERAQYWPELLGRAEGVPLALDDQQGHADVRQMSGAQLLRPARRMQRVSQ